MIDALTAEFGQLAHMATSPEQLFDCKFLDRQDIQTLNCKIKEFLISLSNTEQTYDKLRRVIAKLPGADLANKKVFL